MDTQNTQQNNNVDDTPRIRTFQSDIADAIKDQKGSIVKIAVQEQERKQQQGLLYSTQNKRNTIFITAGIILFVIAGSIFGYSYWQEKMKQKNAIADLPQKKSFISADHITEVSIPDTAVLPAILQKNIVGLDIPVGQIEQMLLVYTDENKNKTVVPLEDIFSSLSIAPPDGFFYSLTPNTYMIGVYQTTENERFILLKSKVFSNTFSQMLVWEKTITKDLKSILALESDEETKIIFKDKIIKNEDVRTAYAQEREVVSYVFFGPKKEFLLIAKKQDTLQSLLGRFTTKLLEQ